MRQSSNKKPAFRRGHFGPTSDSILSVSLLISSMYSGLRIFASARSSSRVMRTLSVPLSRNTRRYSATLLNSLSAMLPPREVIWLGLPSCGNTIAARLRYSTEKAKTFKLGHYQIVSRLHSLIKRCYDGLMALNVLMSKEQTIVLLHP